MSLIYFTVWVDVLISTVGVKYNWTKFSRILQTNLIILILAQVFGKKSILRPIIKLSKGIIFNKKKVRNWKKYFPVGFIFYLRHISATNSRSGIKSSLWGLSNSCLFLVIFSQCHANQRSGATTNTVEPLLLCSSVESTAQIYIEMLNSVIVAALWLNAHDELDVWNSQYTANR